MTAERKGASFNPDEASGGFDKGRVTITRAKVETYKAERGKTAGTEYTRLALGFAPAAGGEEIPYNILIGNAEEWTPNASGTEAIPTREDGKFWNKSEIYRFMLSLVNAGFPKTRMGSDFTVLVGLDLDVERVSIGGTHKDAEGKERPNTALLAMKVYTSQADLNSGAYSKNVKASAAKPRTTTTNAVSRTVTPVAAQQTGGDLRAYAQRLLVSILQAQTSGSFLKADIHKPAYIAITKAKRGAERNDIIQILQDQEFIDGLVAEGVVVDDGETLSLEQVPA